MRLSSVNFCCHPHNKGLKRYDGLDRTITFWYSCNGMDESNWIPTTLQELSEDVIDDMEEFLGIGYESTLSSEDDLISLRSYGFEIRIGVIEAVKSLMCSFFANGLLCSLYNS